MVEPRGCVEMRCRYLYSFVDMLTGTQYVGCMQGVFGAKVELDAVLQPGGFGGVKMTGEALPHCQFSVERAYEGLGESYECVNRRFFDCADGGPEGIKAFDLRDV
jgi:hypothetical protein